MRWFAIVTATLLAASSALLAPYLQNLGGYSVSQAGLLMVPRGVGTMIAMMVAGRLVNRIDPRLVILIGIVIITVTMGQMSAWTRTSTRPPSLFVETTWCAFASASTPVFSTLFCQTRPSRPRTAAPGSASSRILPPSMIATT